MAGRPRPGGRAPHLYFLADAGRHGAGPLSPGPAMGSSQELGSPSRRPPSPASAQACWIPGPAAAPLPRRLHFEKSRRYLPSTPPRPAPFQVEAASDAIASRQRRPRRSPSGKGEAAPARGVACSVSPAAVTAHAQLRVRRRRWRPGS